MDIDTIHNIHTVDEFLDCFDYDEWGSHLWDLALGKMKQFIGNKKLEAAITEFLDITDSINYPPDLNKLGFLTTKGQLLKWIENIFNENEEVGLILANPVCDDSVKKRLFEQLTDGRSKQYVLYHITGDVELWEDIAGSADRPELVNYATQKLLSFNRNYDIANLAMVRAKQIMKEDSAWNTAVLISTLKVADQDFLQGLTSTKEGYKHDKRGMVYEFLKDAEFIKKALIRDKSIHVRRQGISQLQVLDPNKDYSDFYVKLFKSEKSLEGQIFLVDQINISGTKFPQPLISALLSSGTDSSVRKAIFSKFSTVYKTASTAKRQLLAPELTEICRNYLYAIRDGLDIGSDELLLVELIQILPNNRSLIEAAYDAAVMYFESGGGRRRYMITNIFKLFGKDMLFSLLSDYGEQIERIFKYNRDYHVEDMFKSIPDDEVGTLAMVNKNQLGIEARSYLRDKGYDDY